MKVYEPGVCPLGPSRRVKTAVRKAVKNVGRRPYDERTRFERLLFSKFGIGRANVLLVNSLKELVYAITASLRPKNVLVMGPAVGLYGDAARAAGARVEYLQRSGEEGWMQATEALEKNSTCFDMVFIANPNRITGRVVEESALLRLIDRVSAGQGHVVIDESLIEFTRSRGLVDRPLLRDGLIVLRTTACYYGLAGLELAYAVSSERAIDEMRRLSHGELNLPAIAAAHAAMKDKTYRKLTGRFMETEKRLFKAAFRGMEGMALHDSDANVFCISSEKCLSEAARMAAKAGLAAEFSENGLDGPCLSISIMKHEHNLKLIKIIKKVCAKNEGGTPRKLHELTG